MQKCTEFSFCVLKPLTGCYQNVTILFMEHCEHSSGKPRAGTEWSDIRLWEAARGACMLDSSGALGGGLHSSWDNPAELETGQAVEDAIGDLLMLCVWQGINPRKAMLRAWQRWRYTMSQQGVESEGFIAVDQSRTEWARGVLDEWRNACELDQLWALGAAARIADGGRTEQDLEVSKSGGTDVRTTG